MDGEVSIGYLIPEFPGQTHSFFWREIMELERRRVRVGIFSTRLPPEGVISPDLSEVAIARTEYLWPPGPAEVARALLSLPVGAVAGDIRREGPALLLEILACLPPARRLAQRCRARNIAHVHVHSCGRAALIAALANCITGLSYSLTLHGPLSDYGIGQRLKWRRAAFATVITRKLLAEISATLGQDLPRRLSVRPMGVDIETFSRPDAYRPAAPGEPVRLFACGRLHVVKGHQDLLQAVRLLADRGIDVQLEIAGEDEAGGSGFRRTLETRLRELGLAERVRLLGTIGQAEVRQKLLQAHLFVLASWHEPLGVAYMEAMSCEVPTIGTDAGGVRELIVDGESGLLVPPRDPAALAGAIGSIVADPERALRIGRTGRTRIVEAFRSTLSAETVLAGFAEAINSVPAPIRSPVSSGPTD
jgi:colanic acid/amylovoran biosynthesis glycosyltransferase